MTIYSIRDSLGQEVWWTTSRTYAIKTAAELNEIGEGALMITAGGRSWADSDKGGGCGLRSHQLPVAVYKSSVVKAEAAPVRCPVCKDAACETKSRQCGKGA